MSRWTIALAAVFVLSRGAAALAGVRFDVEPLGYFYQYLDPDLLRHDLLRSLAHLHMQPPLFNALLGLGLKLAPESPAAAFHPLFLATGLALALAVFHTMRRLSVPAPIAFGITVVFVVSPAFLLYESHLFYPLPAAALLGIAALFLHRHASDGRLADGVIAFGLLAVVALTRSLFHLVWLVALVGWLLAVRRREWRRTAVVAAPAVLAVGFWYLRTAVLFGSFAASTWFGMNFSKITTLQGPMAERREMVREGELSPFAVIRPFRALDRYESELPPHRPTGVPALDEPAKSTGERNLNHASYVEVSRIYGEDCRRVLTTRPAWYLRGIGAAVHNSFHPASGGEFLEGNREKVRPLLAIFSVAHVAGNLPVILTFLGVVGWTVRKLARAARRGELGSAENLTVAFLGLNVVWVFLAGNLFDLGENYRFRFLGFPATFVLLGLIARDVARARRRRASMGAALS